MTKTLCGLAFAFARSFAPGLAHADYVCDVQMLGATQSSYGDYGHITFRTTTGPGCSGALTGSFWMCTNKANCGPTYTNCAVSLYSRMSPTQLPIFYSELVRAARESQRVSVSQSLCIGGGNTCALGVTFQAN